MESSHIKNSDKSENTQNLVITGSSGWLSSNFLFHLNEIKHHKNIIIHKVSSQNYKDQFHEITKKRLKDIIFIHNGFMRAEALKNENYKNSFKNQANINLKFILDFLKNNNIKSMFYPSSGSVYKLRNIDKTIYRDYSEQKLIEENEFIKIANENKFDLLITRVFSSIGPFMTNHLNFALGSFISQALEDKRIIIESSTNDKYSYISLKNLSNLIIGFTFNREKMNIRKFDVFDENLSILELANKIASKLHIDDLQYDFDDKKDKQFYLGNNSEYLDFLRDLSIERESLDNAITNTIDTFKNN